MGLLSGEGLVTIKGEEEDQFGIFEQGIFKEQSDRLNKLGKPAFLKEVEEHMKEAESKSLAQIKTMEEKLI